MHADRKGSDTVRHAARFSSGELSALIGSLNGLYRRVSSKLWAKRIASPSPPEASEREIEIASVLEEHLERTAVDGSDPLVRGPVVGEAGGTRPGSIHDESRGLIGNILAKFFGRKRSLIGMSPHLAEKMQASTMAHINTALHLAKQGDTDGARLHAELAENAMRIAGQYMEKDSYLAFRKKVEGRLASIVRS